MLPFAYIFATIHKLRLAFARRIYRPRKDLLCDLVFFFILGPFILLISQATDLYHFFRHLFDKNTHKLDATKV